MARACQLATCLTDALGSAPIADSATKEQRHERHRPFLKVARLHDGDDEGRAADTNRCAEGCNERPPVFAASEVGVTRSLCDARDALLVRFCPLESDFVALAGDGAQVNGTRERLRRRARRRTA